MENAFKVSYTYIILRIITCSSYVMVSCSQEVAPNQNEYIRGPSGYIIHI